MSLKNLLAGIMLVLLCLCLSTASAQEADALPIDKLFPKLTRIGEKQTAMPVYPVYQLSELLGYAWVSTEINDLPGFAGKPIKLLIGLDTEGKFSGVEVLDHHEPVFLHGLGNESLLEFMAQYQGRSVADQIIVSTANNRRKAGEEGGPVFIDGVTKATVSVLIINDVMLSTALGVARQYLEGFEAPPQSALKEVPYSPLTLDQLLDEGLLLHWQISGDDASDAFGRDIRDFPEFADADTDETPFIDLYYGFINAPLIGRNLIGDDAWNTLMDRLPDGDALLWVGSLGLFPHASDDFTPASASDRLTLMQNGAVLEMKDYNVGENLSRPALADLPPLDRVHIFRIRNISGFDLGGQSELALNVTLAMNHLVREQRSLTTTYQLPEAMWERLEVNLTDISAGSKPLWQRIWEDRTLDIGILSASLLVLLWVFIRQDKVSRNARAFHAFRWAWLWFMLLYIGFYLQGQLSVVNIFTLLHAIVDGFDITIFLLDPVIFILWCVTFASLFLWGRGLFCGWLCPFGAMQEMASWLGKKLRLKQWRISETTHRRLIYLKYPILITLVVSSFYSLTLAERLAEVEPFKTSITLVFVRHWPFVLYAVALLAIGMVVHKFYCRYLCPLGAGLAVVGFFRGFHWLKRIEMCGKPCQTCHNRCEIGAIPRSGKIDYNECVQCLECIVILNDEKQCAAKLLENKRKVIPVKAVPAGNA